MPTREPAMWMWSEACEVLDRAERLHRQFFRPGASAQRPTWQPPIDLIETDRDLLILVALPGVAAEQVEVIVDGGVLIVTGERPLPAVQGPAVIHRLEIPYGRFERRIGLPSGRFEIGRRELVDGCLQLGLRKLR